MSASIAHVAQRAYVSRTTVSHVLSGNRPVSREVADRVRAAMTELQYVPSRAARNLALGSTQTVGLLVPDISNGFFADLAKGVEATCIERGINVLLCNTGWKLEREIFYLETLRSRAVDGVIYASGAPPAASLLGGLLADLPVVAVDEQLPRASITSITSKNRTGGRMVADHLLSLGHGAAVVVGASPTLGSSKQRVAGFQSAWKKGTGLPARVVMGAFNEASGIAAVATLSGAIRAGEITAIFAVNDLCALGVLEGLRQAKVSVPGDCSVVGFDDVMAARHANPSLTTVRQDAVGMGARAASALLDRITERTDDDCHRTALPVNLIVRDSTSTSRSTG